MRLGEVGQPDGALTAFPRCSKGSARVSLSLRVSKLVVVAVALGLQCKDASRVSLQLEIFEVVLVVVVVVALGSWCML